MKKFLITGSAGFIGFHLCKLLLEKNLEVVGIDGFTDYYDVKLKRARIKLLKKFKNFKNYECLIENEKNFYQEFCLVRFPLLRQYLSGFF